MKRFKELTEEILNEGGEMYPADEMTMKEIKIACYAAQNILERLENGSMIQRWQISAIVKASEELASVYTSMSADEVDDEEWEDDMDDEEPMYVGFEYPSMYGEEVELEEKYKDPWKVPKKGSIAWNAAQQRKKADRDPEEVKRVNAIGDKNHMIGTAKVTHNEEVELDEISYRDSGAQNMMRASRNADKEVDKMRAQAAKRAEKEAAKKKPVEEETDYEVDVEGLPKMYVKADNPSQVKNNLRKVVKNPEMIRGVERVAKATLQKIFRDKASGKEEVAEEVEQIDELKKSTLGSYVRKASVDAYRRGQDTEYHTAARDATDNYGAKRRHAELTDKARAKASNRITGIEKATRKLAKEEVEINEASDLRITKVYNKFPKKATYAVHSPDRKYYKEFDSMEKAKAHHAEKTGK
jgi:hypothetical protein